MCGAGCRLEIRLGRASGGCSLPNMAWTKMGCVAILCQYRQPRVLKVAFGVQHYQGREEQQLARVRLLRLPTTTVGLTLSLRTGWRILHRGRDHGLADEVRPAKRADRPRGGCHRSCKCARQSNLTRVVIIGDDRSVQDRWGSSIAQIPTSRDSPARETTGPRAVSVSACSFGWQR